MIVLGFGVTVAMVRRGQVPFFFQPLHFLVFDPLSVLTFAGLTGSAILLRNKTEWHRRLHLCGMSMLMGPGFGRLSYCRCHFCSLGRGKQALLRG